MRNIQESITSITKEHDARRHLAVIVCMIAVATVLAVFWSLHIKGITLSSGDLICGLEEHTHTSDCYAWVPVEDETENGSELEETERVSGTEDSAESETASETEESTDTETVTRTEIADGTAASGTEAASETVIESATESVSTETGTEALTEDGSETLTEEETESAQVGDTKVIDGVEYVYTLICGMEEHTHTDECYADDSADKESEETESEESATGKVALTAGVANLGAAKLGSSGSGASAGVSAIAEEGNGGNNGISVASSGTLGNTGNTTSNYYYFADKVTASEALSNPGDYVVYTEINDAYYLVDGNGSLSKLSNLASSTDSYLKWYSDGEIDYYKWALSETNSLNYLYNESYGHWLSPSKQTTISRNNSRLYISRYDLWGECSDACSISDSTIMAFNITGGGNSAAESTFGVEIKDDNGNYIRTMSSLEAVASATDAVVNINILDGTSGTNEFGGSMTYIVIIERSGETYTITYYDKTNSKVKMIVTVSDSDLSGNDVAIRVYSGRTTYTLSVDVLDSVETESYYNIDTTTVKDYTDTTMTTPAGNAVVGTVELEGNFDVTYSFKNKGNVDSSSNGTWNNYLVQVEDDNGQIVYIRSDECGWITSNGNDYRSWDNGGGYFERSIEFDTTYATETEAWAAWAEAMNSGAEMKVNVVWNSSSKILTVTSTGAGATIIIKVNLSSFDFAIDDIVTLSLTGEYCILSDISLSYNSVKVFDYMGLTYSVKDSLYLKNYSTTQQEITITEATGNAWTGSYTNSNNTVWNLFAELNSVNAVEWITSDGKALTNSDASATCSGGTVTIGSTVGSVELCFARIRSFTAYFDGTNGAVGYYNQYVGTNGANSAYVVTSSSMDSTGTYIYVDMSNVTSTNTGRYSYAAKGWYDIYFNEYYDTSTTTIKYEYGKNNNCTVLYADWVATEFVGYDSTDTSTENTPVASLDTSNFINTKVFDYNDLFNLYSAYLDSTSVVSTTGHSEVWKFTTSSYGTNNLFGKTALGFIFLNTGGYALTDIDGRRAFEFDSNHTVNGANTTVNAETAGLLTFANIDSTNLLKYLFDTDTVGDYAAYNSSTGKGVIGKNYVGTANYLFQYDDASGYYYFDSAKNAAFYDSANSRFYLYDYLVRMIKSTKDTDDSDSDFLPFNYGYVTQRDSDGTKQIVSSSIDYFFGMETDITFYLPDDTGTYNPNTGGYGNQTSEGTDMVFKFMGDDDVWVLVDGQLVLDLGGIHDAVYGEINFSTGTVTVVSNTNEYSSGVTYVDQSIDRSGIPISVSSDVAYNKNGDGTYTLTYDGTTVGKTTSLSSISSGTHTLTFYYLERGASESNAAIYLSVSSQYQVDMTKVTEQGTSVEGASFDVYNTSSIDNVGDSAYKVLSYTIKTGNTGISIPGLVTGNTYYIVETAAPEGYPISHNIIKVYVSSSGDAEITIYASDKTTVLATWKSTDSSFSTGSYLTDTPTVTDTTGTNGTVIYTLVFTYSNNLEYELPSTGSAGITRYLLIGETLVVIAIIGLALMVFYQFVWIRKFSTMKNNEEYTGENSKQSKNFARMRGHPRERSITHGHARDRPGDR